MARVLTAEEIGKVKRARAKNRPWKVIARLYDLSIEGLRRQVDPEYREKRNAYQAHYMKATYRERNSYRTPRMPPEGNQRPGLKVLTEAPSIIMPPPPEPMSLTAILMGDPPPSRSALAQKREKF